MPEITDSWYRWLLTQHSSSATSTGDHRLIVCNTEPRADAGRLIDVTALSRATADLFNNLFHEVGHNDRVVAIERNVTFLLHDLDPGVTIMRIMSLNQAADAVLQLWNHFSAAVISRRICREQNHDIQIKLNGVTANLHVPFFKDIEQADLHKFIQFG